MFDNLLIRYSISGTLITCYAVTDFLARRRGRTGRKLPTPVWVHPLIAASVGGFYLLIGPTGGPLLGGLANAAGVGLAAFACVVRWMGRVQYPGPAARSLFYVALPLAVGAPWGLLVLTAPALAATLYCCTRADRLEQPAGVPVPEFRYRLFEGIW